MEQLAHLAKLMISELFPGSIHLRGVGFVSQFVEIGLNAFVLKSLAEETQQGKRGDNKSEQGTCPGGKTVSQPESRTRITGKHPNYGFCISLKTNELQRPRGFRYPQGDSLRMDTYETPPQPIVRWIGAQNVADTRVDILLK